MRSVRQRSRLFLPHPPLIAMIRPIDRELREAKTKTAQPASSTYHYLRRFQQMLFCYAPHKRKQHVWLTIPNIFGCYMLRPFAHPVACCCVLLGVVAQSLKPVKRLATCKRTQQLTTLLGQQCWELLRPFTPGFKQQIPQATIAQSQFKVYDGIFANSCPASRIRYFARSQICRVTCSERNKESFSLGYGLLVHATRSSGTSRTGLT